MPPELQRTLATLHDHDVDDVVVLLGRAVRIAIEQAEAVIPVVGERLPRRMIGPHLLRKRRVTRPQFGRCPMAITGLGAGKRAQCECGQTDGREHPCHERSPLSG